MTTSRGWLGWVFAALLFVGLAAIALWMATDRDMDRLGETGVTRARVETSRGEAIPGHWPPANESSKLSAEPLADGREVAADSTALGDSMTLRVHWPEAAAVVEPAHELELTGSEGDILGPISCPVGVPATDLVVPGSTHEAWALRLGGRVVARGRWEGDAGRREIDLRGLPQLRGQVVGEGSGLSDAEVTLRPGSGRAAWEVRASTRATGQFCIPAVPADILLDLGAQSPGWQARWLPGLVATHDDHLLLELSAVDTIRVRVVASDGAPVPGAHVEMWSGGRRTEARTDLQGTAELTLALASPVELLAEHPDHGAARCSSDVAALMDPVQLVLTSGLVVAGVAVWEADGAPAPGVHVTATPLWSPVEAVTTPGAWTLAGSATTDLDGRFRIPGVIADRVEVRAHGPASTALTTPTAAPVRLELPATRVWNVRVRALDPESGAPVLGPGARWAARNTSGWGRSGDCLRGDGDWLVLAVTANGRDPCDLTLLVPGYQAATVGQARLMSELEGPLHQVWLRRDETKELRVVDPQGSPVGGADVEVHWPLDGKEERRATESDKRSWFEGSSSSGRSGRTGQQGLFSCRVPSDRPLRVSVRRTGYAPVVQDWGTAESLTVELRRLEFLQH